VGISRGSVYYLPRPVPASDLEIMRRLDRLHLEFPFAGSRMLRGLLAAEGCKVGRRHVRTLMKRMGMEVLYRRPRTTKPELGHKIHPYLLRGPEIARPNQVWAMDITYIAMARGFVYLAVVLDWFSRRERWITLIRRHVSGRQLQLNKNSHRRDQVEELLRRAYIPNECVAQRPYYLRWRRSGRRLR
jgi:hypothetical protein